MKRILYAGFLYIILILIFYEVESCSWEATRLDLYRKSRKILIGFPLKAIRYVVDEFNLCNGNINYPDKENWKTGFHYDLINLLIDCMFIAIFILLIYRYISAKQLEFLTVTSLISVFTSLLFTLLLILNITPFAFIFIYFSFILLVAIVILKLIHHFNLQGILKLIAIGGMIIAYIGYLIYKFYVIFVDVKLDFQFVMIKMIFVSFLFTMLFIFILKLSIFGFLRIRNSDDIS